LVIVRFAPQKRTFVSALSMSALCHKQTFETDRLPSTHLSALLARSFCAVFCLEAENMSQTAMNIAAITGPMTKPYGVMAAIQEDPFDRPDHLGIGDGHRHDHHPERLHGRRS
jgi:hypothetical protein